MAAPNAFCPRGTFAKNTLNRLLTHPQPRRKPDPRRPGYLVHDTVMRNITHSASNNLPHSELTACCRAKRPQADEPPANPAPAVLRHFGQTGPVTKYTRVAPCCCSSTHYTRRTQDAPASCASRSAAGIGIGASVQWAGWMQQALTLVHRRDCGLGIGALPCLDALYSWLNLRTGPRHRTTPFLGIGYLWVSCPRSILT